MHAWICRILSFVFLVNILFPVSINSQNYSWNNNMEVDIRKLEKNLPNPEIIRKKILWDNYMTRLNRMPKSPYYSEDIVLRHKGTKGAIIQDAYDRAIKIYPTLDSNSSTIKGIPAAKQDNLRVNTPTVQMMEIKRQENLKYEMFFAVPKFTGQRFLEIISEGIYLLDGYYDGKGVSLQFIEQWIDPHALDEMYEPIIITYAAETMGHIIDQVLLERNQEELNYLLMLLPNIQQRILYRIDYIEYMYGKIEKIPQELLAALGSLRITAAKIGDFYKQINKKDPLADRGLKPSALYKGYSDKFLSEIEHFLSLDLEDESALQQHAVIWVDYASTYFIKTEQYDKLEKLVNLLDKSMDRTDYLQEGTPLLQSLFISIFENYVQMDKKSKSSQKIISPLKNFSKNKYSVTTRVFALDVASAISRYLGRPSQTEDKKYSNANSNRQWGSPSIQYHNAMPYRDRVYFAKKVSEIYCPATDVAYLGYPAEDYGLNSSQLTEFANQLAYLYDGFLDISSTAISSPDSKTHQDNLGKCVVKMFNTPNKKMVDNENTELFFSVVGEALFWVYGGALLSASFRFIGTAYRSVRGVTLASPKIIKAAVKAPSGRGLTAVVVETKKAVRYANATQNLTKQGAQIVVTANQASGAVGKGTVATAETAARGASNPTTFVARNMAQLSTGQRYWWQRLGSSMRGNPRGAITEISVVQRVPGFTYNVGKASVGGTRLAGGIHNYDDLRYFQRLLRTSTEQGGSVPFKLVDLSKPWKSPNGVFYGSNKFPLTGKELLSREMELSFAAHQAVQQGKFDLWLINNGVGYNISRTADLSTLPWKGSQNFFVAPSSTMKTLNLAEAYSGGALKIGDRMAIPWMPANSPEALSLAKHLLSKPSQWGQLQTWSVKQLGRFPTSPSNLDWLPSFTNHLSTTGQLDLLAENLIQSTKFWQGFTGNLKFFAGWRALDYAISPFMNNWVENKAGAQYEELLTPYKDTFEQVKQDQEEQNSGVEPAPEPAPAPLGIYDAVNAAKKDGSQGALISFPMLAILHSKPGQYLFGERSFVAEKDEVFFAHLAAKLDLSHALYTSEKTKMAKQSIEQIEADRTTQVAQARAVGGKAAAQEMQAAYDALIAKAKKLQEDNAPAGKWDKELKKERQEVEYLVLFNTIRTVEQQRDKDLLFLSAYGGDWAAKGKKAYDAYINALKEVLSGGDFLSKKNSKKLEKLSEQFVQEMRRLKKELPSRSRSASTYYTDEMFNTVSYIQFLEDQKHMAMADAMYSPEDGAKLMAIFDDAIRKMEDLENRSGLSQQNKMEKKKDIMSEWYEKMEIFQQEHRPDEMRVFDANTKMQLSYVPETDKAKYQALIDAYRPHLKVIVEDSSLSEEDRIAKVLQFWEEFANEWSNVSAGVAQPEEVPAGK